MKTLRRESNLNKRGRKATGPYILAFLALFIPQIHAAGQDIVRLRLENQALREENARLLHELDSLKAASQQGVDEWDGEAVFIWDDLIFEDSNVSLSSGTPFEGSYQDVYEKAASAFPSVYVPFNATLQSYITLWSEKKRGGYNAALRRYMKYEPMFRRVFRQAGVPEEITALCIVESAGSTKAYSKAGAAGLWQLMESTATSLGLKADPFNDERYDPDLSTIAAAKYLVRMHNRYNNWALAVSAYNCGPGNIDKAIRLAGGKTDYWSIYKYLPQETKGYLPTLLAVLTLMNED